MPSAPEKAAVHAGSRTLIKPANARIAFSRKRRRQFSFSAAHSPRLGDRQRQTLPRLRLCYFPGCVAAFPVSRQSDCIVKRSALWYNAYVHGLPFWNRRKSIPVALGPAMYKACAWKMPDNCSPIPICPQEKLCRRWVTQQPAILPSFSAAPRVMLPIEYRKTAHRA